MGPTISIKKPDSLEKQCVEMREDIGGVLPLGPGYHPFFHLDPKYRKWASGEESERREFSCFETGEVMAHRQSGFYKGPQIRLSAKSSYLIKE